MVTKFRKHLQVRLFRDIRDVHAKIHHDLHDPVPDSYSLILSSPVHHTLLCLGEISILLFII